ncbi:MAG: hypothetical protein QOD63_2847 [Actinomycetota bacterium]|jgi:hypothetical protein|nr:hypothetical protein [Actinomycetota bacterium]
MDVSEYRRRYEAELEQAARSRTTFGDLLQSSGTSSPRLLAAGDDAAAGGDEADAALVVLRDPDAGEELRAAALQVIGSHVEERPDLIDALLDILRDKAVPADQRLAVLGLLQEISFRFVLFPAKRPDYLEALRSIIDDPDAQLRRRAIGILAREKDEYVQRRLVAGLKGESKALVPAAKAIQFLGYDVHADYFPLLKTIVADPPSRTAKKEALRLLAADPSSSDLLLGVLRDENESPDVRKVSALALQSVAPEQLEAEARRILLDDDEDDGLRTMSLNTLTYFANPAAMSQDDELARGVERLRAGSTSKQLKQATTAFISKHTT